VTTEQKKTGDARRIKTDFFRMSFPSIVTTRTGDDGKERYELTMLFPPGKFNKAVYMAAFEAAMSEKYGADKSKWPKLKHKPSDVIRDFAEYNSAANKPLAGDWTGWTMCRAKKSADNGQLSVVGPLRGADGKFPAITDAREVYGGRWARATLDAFVYERKDGKGVSLGLANVQLAQHDNRFGAGSTKPEDDFDNVPAEMLGEADSFDGGGEVAANEDAPW
jgi:hypothetical protein